MTNINTYFRDFLIKHNENYIFDEKINNHYFYFLIHGEELCFNDEEILYSNLKNIEKK